MNLIDFSAKVLEDVRDGMPADLPLVVRVPQPDGSFIDMPVVRAELCYPISQYTIFLGEAKSDDQR